MSADPLAELLVEVATARLPRSSSTAGSVEGQSPIQLARSAVKVAEVQRTQLRHRLGAIAQLFGTQVRASLVDPLELFEDAAFDAFSYFEQARAVSGDRMERRLREVEEARSATARALGTTEQLLDAAIQAELARSKKSGRPPAEWCSKGIEQLEKDPF